MVLYFHQKNISRRAFKDFENFVSRGGGVLAVHSATASFKKENRYFDILGGRFKKHGPVEEFHIHPDESPDPIFGNIETFSVKDELYLHDYSQKIQVHYFADVDGKSEPLVWTHLYGAGRVCYVSFGHTSSSMQHPAVRQILQRGLQWSITSGAAP